MKTTIKQFILAEIPVFALGLSIGMIAGMILMVHLGADFVNGIFKGGTNILNFNLNETLLVQELNRTFGGR